MFLPGGIGPLLSFKPYQEESRLHRRLTIKDGPPLSFLVLDHNLAAGRPEVINPLP